MKQYTIGLQELAHIFLKIGVSAFGGWSTTALLLEKELADKRKIITKDRLHGSVAYAQVLPGATQVAIVSGVGYKLRGFAGAVVATICYLAPALSLMTVFAALYFQYADTQQLMDHMKGLIAALGGLIMANAYRIGKRHASHRALWLLILAAFTARLVMGINAVTILFVFGGAGLAWSWVKSREKAHG